jgi:pyruvate dehydrogenase kinase 2/3/4
LPKPNLSTDLRERLLKGMRSSNGKTLTGSTPNPSVKPGQYRSDLPNANGNGQKGLAVKRYYVPSDDGEEWPPELNQYNKRFAEALEKIKRRHDSVVTTVGMLNKYARISNSRLTSSSTGCFRMETETTAHADRQPHSSFP